jgi:hypothetical protein
MCWECNFQQTVTSEENLDARLLLFDGDLKPRMLDEIISSHKGLRVQFSVFLYLA